eukprot:5881567-Pyramimonas_sp.AAC.3
MAADGHTSLCTLVDVSSSNKNRYLYKYPIRLTPQHACDGICTMVCTIVILRTAQGDPGRTVFPTWVRIGPDPEFFGHQTLAYGT